MDAISRSDRVVQPGPVAVPPVDSLISRLRSRRAQRRRQKELLRLVRAFSG